MELNKLIHDGYEITKHWHLPLLTGLFAAVRINSKKDRGMYSDLGDITGDNVLPREIIISLSSRRGSKVAFV